MHNASILRQFEQWRKMPQIKSPRDLRREMFRARKKMAVRRLPRRWTG
jgi:hypothetical protein